MRLLPLMMAVAVAACSGTTKAGPIGQPINLRSYLPDSLQTKEPGGTDSSFRQKMIAGPDSAQVELSWTSYRHGSGQYLADVRGQLLADVRYDSLRLVDVSDLENRGSKAAADESARIRVRWWKRGLTGMKTGAMNFQFTATGHSLVGPPEPR